MPKPSMKHVIWFLRPTLLVLACFAVAFALSFGLSQQSVDSLDQRIAKVSEFADELGPIQKPSPKITPEQVAGIQSAALGDPDWNRGAVQCMSFASPDNLVLTGPLEKFARMVRGPKFAALSAPNAVLVGKPVFQANNARVLVTAISKDELVSAFVWVLEKQTSGVYKDCWMTDGVFPLTNNKSAKNSEWTDNEI